MKAGDRKIIIAVTGASGSVYGRLLVEKLLGIEGVAEIALVFSDCGRDVAEYENQAFPDGDPRIRRCSNANMFDAAASGSSGYDAMVVIPCSMGTLGRMASGVSCDLISRAADVMMKERRRLILVPRETPLNTIHLRNMTLLSECGAVIMPASPSFYSHPSDVETLCMTVVDRVVMLLGLGSPDFTWNGREK